MLSDWWLWFLALGAICITAESLPAGATETTKNNEQLLRPKIKRTQELLMFGNQQSHQVPEKNTEKFSPPLNKRTLSNSGLDDISSSLTETEQQSPSHLKGLSNSYVIERSNIPLHENNYEYGNILVNEVADVLPRGIWEIPPQRHYYGFGVEDRRKRSEDSNSNSQPLSSSTSSSSTLMTGSTTSPTISPAPSPSISKPIVEQLKRSIPSHYQEPRYKRESELDPEEYLALLAFYENERRNRGNWRNYGNEEYETVDEEPAILNLHDEDSRSSPWLITPSGYSEQRGYGINDHIVGPAIDIPVSKPISSYDLYQQYGGLGNQQYDPNVQYGTPQYSIPYIQRAYYPPEKRFMMNRKRSQNYDSYRERRALLLNNRGYLNYKNHLLY